MQACRIDREDKELDEGQLFFYGDKKSVLKAILVKKHHKLYPEYPLTCNEGDELFR